MKKRNATTANIIFILKAQSMFLQMTTGWSDLIVPQETTAQRNVGRIGEVVFVAFTERGEKIRLISARLATAKERRFYYGNSDFTVEGWERTF